MFSGNVLCHDELASDGFKNVDRCDTISKALLKSSAFDRFRSLPRPFDGLDESMECIESISSTIKDENDPQKKHFHDNSEYQLVSDNSPNGFFMDFARNELLMSVSHNELLMSVSDNMMFVNLSSSPKKRLSFSSDEDSGIFTDDESPVEILTFSEYTPLGDVAFENRESRCNKNKDITAPAKRQVQETTNDACKRRRLNDECVPEIGVEVISRDDLMPNDDLSSYIDQDSLIGDFSRPYCLPTIPGKHQDLKSVSPETISQLLNGHYSPEVATYHVIDCRYPYEFEAGHIGGATNFWRRDEILEKITQHNVGSQQRHGRNVIIFHCEFSSERGPKMCRYLRQLDRDLNSDSYPSLCYPELYILDGGYKAFYELYPEYCTPRDYKPMVHPDHVNDVKYFRIQAKSRMGEKASRGSHRRQKLIL